MHAGWLPACCSPLPQVGTSLCNFLTLTATFGRSADGGQSGEVLLRFGSAAHLHTGTGDGACGPAADAEEAAAASHLEWPALGGVKVLGWHLPAEGATVELVQQADACRLAVVERLSLPAGAAAVAAGGLHIDLSSLNNVQLKCGVGVRVRWSAPASGGGGGVAASA